jgi:hypothetical protein
VVPVRADMHAAAYNVDAVWARIVALIPEAERARLVRVLADVRTASGWGNLWTQAVNAGRVLRSTFGSQDASRGDEPDDKSKP